MGCLTRAGSNTLILPLEPSRTRLPGSLDAPLFPPSVGPHNPPPTLSLPMQQKNNDLATPLQRRLASHYDDLRRVARTLLVRRPAPSVESVDLAHDAILKLIREEHSRHRRGRSLLAEKNASVLRACFGRACCDILSGRRRRRLRRAEARLSCEPATIEGRNVAEVSNALAALRARDPLEAAILEARVSLTIRECASQFQISESTIKRYHRSARTWLRSWLAGR